jgi:hypothetical protein
MISRKNFALVCSYSFLILFFYAPVSFSEIISPPSTNPIPKCEVECEKGQSCCIDTCYDKKQAEKQGLVCCPTAGREGLWEAKKCCAVNAYYDHECCDPANEDCCGEVKINLAAGEQCCLDERGVGIPVSATGTCCSTPMCSGSCRACEGQCYEPQPYFPDCCEYPNIICDDTCMSPEDYDGCCDFGTPSPCCGGIKMDLENYPQSSCCRNDLIGGGYELFPCEYGCITINGIKMCKDPEPSQQPSEEPSKTPSVEPSQDSPGDPSEETSSAERTEEPTGQPSESDTIKEASGF